MPNADALENQNQIRKLFETVINPGRLERLDDVIADSYTGPRGERGPEGFKSVLAALRTGLPDLKYSLKELVADANQVAVRWTLSGTHLGTLNGLAPTGRRLTSAGMAIFQFEGGKVVRASLLTDRLELLQQLGVVPNGFADKRPEWRFHVDSFRGPDSARGEFEAALKRNMSFIRGLPGFVGHTVLEQSDAEHGLAITTIAIWNDQAALEAAVTRVRAYYSEIGFDGQAALARWGVTLERGIFQAPAPLQ